MGASLDGKSPTHITFPLLTWPSRPGNLNQSMNLDCPFSHINPANSGILHLNIADITGKIFLPHFKKESQPLLEQMSISTKPK